jgi:predicted enzyme related to lactoylglutathione lyase
MHVKLVELPVDDQQRAKEFYVQAFGGRVAADRAYGPGGWRWIEIALPGAQTHILLTRRSAAPADRPSLVFLAADIEAEAERLRGQRVAFVTEVSPAPWAAGASFCEVLDSEGNRLVITDR